MVIARFFFCEEYCIIEQMDNPPLILIVDDDPDFIEIFKTKLESAGYMVQTAKDGVEGIEKTKKIHPKLVLMDVQMPNMNGIEAMIKIKEDSQNADIPVLFLTALGDPRTDIQEINRRLSKELGALGYIKKTDDLDNVVAYIKSFLQ